MNLRRSIIKRINKLLLFYRNKQRLKTKNIANIWCFLPYGDDFTGNIKATFESVKHDPNIIKIILADKATESLYKHLVNPSIILIEESNLLQKKNFLILSKASILITDQLTNAYEILKKITPLYIPVLNLWHGIPLKKMFYAVDKQSPFTEDEALRNHFISSSELDTQSMQKCFQVPLQNIHLTGLPRVDLLHSPTADLQQEYLILKEVTKDKKLLLFAPTWKSYPSKNYTFTPYDLQALSLFLQEENYILGVREHFLTEENSYFQQLQTIGAINLNNTEFPNIEPILLHAKVLVTDYSSCHYDFLYLNKPSFSFAYDYEHYDKGFLYDFADVFQYPKSYTIQDLLQRIRKVESSTENTDIQQIYQRFYKYSDNQNTQRVINLIKNLASNN